MQIARKVQSIEHMKVALVEQVAQVYRAIESSNERDIANALGQMIILSYMLGHQLDIAPAAIDAAAEQALPEVLLSESTDTIAIETVLRYLRTKR